MRQLSLLELFCWTTVLAGTCAISPWREADAVIRVLLIIVPTGTVIALLARGKRAAWWYAVSVCAVLITIDSLVLNADRRAAVQPGWVTLDAVWAGFVVGTVTWAATVCAAKLIKRMAGHSAEVPEQ